ncbi:MAG: hypothetical protein R3E66_00120 [bacterium]
MSNLPPCGIYKTRQALDGKEEWVRENILVYFHNHSQQGPPLILLPAANAHNRWTFHDKGYLVKDEDFPSTMIQLMPEGYYILNEAIFLSHDEVIPENTLVQMGYNRMGDPILFLSQFDNNVISFPNSGLKCTLEIFDLLRPVDFRTPEHKDQH